ncbi:hypothetical protein IIC65_02035, partial [Candidatus Sumerlaeota bacterium]|nr:hypothetical protein [Candidatus Sumerlaeota bacterium]
MRIAIFVTTPANTYSGGRYHSLMLAEALALGGHEVHYVTDNLPIFHEDLALYPDHEKILIHLTPDFSGGLPAGNFDAVVLIPGTSDTSFYLRTRLFALERMARLVFLNFESGNWFNALSPVKRSLAEWKQWKRACRRASLILSSAKESNRHAKEFYRIGGKGARFDFVYPAINIPADKLAGDCPREARIVVIARFVSAEH